MRKCEQILKKFGVKHDVLIVSAHRTPERLYKFAKNAHKNYSVICSGAGRAAHLSGMCASLTKIPVIGVPIKDKHTDGISSLFSTNEMPNGIPVATTAINGGIERRTADPSRMPCRKGRWERRRQGKGKRGMENKGQRQRERLERER